MEDARDAAVKSAEKVAEFERRLSHRQTEAHTLKKALFQYKHQIANLSQEIEIQRQRMMKAGIIQEAHSIIVDNKNGGAAAGVGDMGKKSGSTTQQDGLDEDYEFEEEEEQRGNGINDGGRGGGGDGGGLYNENNDDVYDAQNARRGQDAGLQRGSAGNGDFEREESDFAA